MQTHHFLIIGQNRKIQNLLSQMSLELMKLDVILVTNILKSQLANYFGVDGKPNKEFSKYELGAYCRTSSNMSDYVITSASVSAIVNGSGDTNLETPGDISS